MSTPDPSALQAEASDLLQAVVDSMPGGGEVRVQQKSMCRSVASAIENARHLILEAGTGTGKSLAYLVPLIASRRKAVVATATKQLQDQLVDNDLPKIGAALDRPLKVSVLKGRANYLCKHKLATLINKLKQQTLEADGLPDNERQDALAEVKAWSEETASGDKAEIVNDLPSGLWEQVSVSGQECPGAKNCDYGEECFAEIAKDEASMADVVIVNTTLYCLNALTDASILPPHDIVVFDEAHKVEENAIEATATRVTGGRFAAAAGAVRRAGLEGDVSEDLDKASKMMRKVLAAYVDKPLDHPLPDDLTDTAVACGEKARRARDALGEKARGNKTDIIIAQRSLHNIVTDINRLLDQDSYDAAWIEKDGRTPAWRAVSANVADLLDAHLWSNVTGILTSATIPSNLAKCLGVPEDEHKAVNVGSPFDYKKAGLLYCADHLPDPRADEWMEQAHRLIADLVTVAGGRTLALFTSRRAMNAAYEAVKEATRLTIYLQEGSPNPELLRRFADEEESCLFATMGMWQGVDVPGSSLSLVIIDKLPFNAPKDPLSVARRKPYGDSAFSVIDVPDAATKLAQGVGRLIRSTSDRGVVAILDQRLSSKPYGRQFIKALPPFALTTDISEAKSFLSGILPDRQERRNGQ